MNRLTFAVCTYNRAECLPRLIATMRTQTCPVPFEILVVDNNSTDGTQHLLRRLAQEGGAPLRTVTETRQGIVFARNRAIEEALNSAYLVFIDDDQLPLPGLLEAAVHAMAVGGADCVGGRIRVLFEQRRPGWLRDGLLGFLGEVDYGDNPFWITDASTPVWTGNAGYRMSIFTQNPELRFDIRYNRAGKTIGGGEDEVMFRELLRWGMRLQYRPDMVVEHYVEQSRLSRSYFLRLHFLSGRKFGQFETPEYPRTILGVPYFMLAQAGHQFARTLLMFLQRDPDVLRQAMTATHATGMIVGRLLRWKVGKR